MEGQLRETDSPLSTALDPQEVEAEETLPSPHNSEKKDEVAAEGGALPPSKPRSKEVVIAKAMVFAFVVILVSGARYIMSKKPRSDVTTSEVPLDDASVQKYFDEFIDAADKMEVVWGSNEAAVLQAFRKHYSPSLRDGQEFPEDSLAIISDHVARMRECHIPPGSSVKERSDFVQHLQFLQAICRTATLRLEELHALADLGVAFSAPMPSVGLGTPSSDSNTEKYLNQEQYDVGLDGFLSTTGVISDKPINRVMGKLAYKLMGLLDIEKTCLASNIVARCYFERFLPSLGKNDAPHAALSTAEYRIPYDKTQVRIGALAQAAAPIFREADSTPNYANVVTLHNIAENWTDEGVSRAAEQQEEENNKYFQNRLNIKREQMRALLKKGIPRDDLVMIALFLL